MDQFQNGSFSVYLVGENLVGGELLLPGRFLVSSLTCNGSRTFPTRKDRRGGALASNLISREGIILMSWPSTNMSARWTPLIVRMVWGGFVGGAGLESTVVSGSLSLR